MGENLAPAGRGAGGGRCCACGAGRGARSLPCAQCAGAIAKRLSRQWAELARLQADTAVRVDTMRDILAGRQAELERALNERLDSVTHHLSSSMTTSRQHTVESLQKLNERLAVIDRAQKNIADLSIQVTSLQNVLANKQQRGAFGQARMEIIVQDGLPKDCYEFQLTLSNKCRPDCAVFLPDKRPLAIDAKFPLEAVTAYREAGNDNDRKLAGSRRAPGPGPAHRGYRCQIPDPGRDPGLGADVRAVGVDLCRIARRLRRCRAEGVPFQGDHRLPVALDARHSCHPADPEGRANAGGGR